MLAVANSVLLVVDVQGKLAELMHEKEALFENLKRIIRGAQLLDLPILCTEQNPQGLGPTVPEIAQLMPGIQPIPKLHFSCMGEQRFVHELRALKRTQALIAGIETHICVYQTAMDLISAGYEAHVVVDAVSSRTAGNKEIGLQRMRDGGATLTGVETALFELLAVAEGPRFKAILQLVR